HHPDNHATARILIGLNHDAAVRLIHPQPLNRSTHAANVHLLPVYPDFPVGVHRDQDVGPGLLFGTVGRGRVDLDARGLDEGAGDDEEDQHDEHDVEHWRQVDTGFVIAAS